MSDEIDEYLSPRPHLPEAVAAAVCADPADPRVPLVMARHLAFHPELQLPLPEDPAVLAGLRKAARATGKLLEAKVSTMAVTRVGLFLVMMVDRSRAQDAVLEHAVRNVMSAILPSPEPRSLRLVRGKDNSGKV
jgi:hypothetical protein